MGAFQFLCTVRWRYYIWQGKVSVFRRSNNIIGGESVPRICAHTNFPLYYLCIEATRRKIICGGLRSLQSSGFKMLMQNNNCLLQSEYYSSACCVVSCVPHNFRMSEKNNLLLIVCYRKGANWCRASLVLKGNCSAWQPAFSQTCCNTYSAGQPASSQTCCNTYSAWQPASSQTCCNTYSAGQPAFSQTCCNTYEEHFVKGSGAGSEIYSHNN